MENLTKEKLIRADSIPVRIYNDGLTVLLYDAAHENLIRETDPKIIWFAGTESFNDAATKKLCESGVLLVYGLPGDDCLNIEIVVGENPCDEKTAGGCRHEPQIGFLKLPSGKLCVHSYNTLPMGDNGAAPPDEGATIDVAPGNYELTIHRIERDETETRGDADDEEKPSEIIILTPAAEIIETANILFRECLE